MTCDRHSRIVALLQTLNDGLPGVRSQWSAFGALPGERATERRPCRVCDETGHVNTRAGSEPCSRCGGHGWYLVDGYTGKREDEPERVAFTGPERERWRRQTDAQLRRLELQLATPSEVSARTLQDERPYAWETVRDRMWRRYDYPALQHALDRLRDTDPSAYALLHSVYVHGWHTQPSATVEQILHRGLIFIDERMPDPIRAPGFEPPKHPALLRRDRRRTAA